MNKLSVPALLLTLLLNFVSIRCSTPANLLQAGSPLISSMSSVPGLSSITTLLQTPGLDKLLGSALKKPFTLLAPTNDALTGLGADAMSKLSNPSNLSQLANLLKDHIIPGKLDPAGLMQSGLKAVSGNALDLGTAKLGNLVGGEKFNVIPIDKVLGKAM